MIVNSVWAAAPVVAMGLSFAAGLALATQLGRVSHGPWHAQRLGLARALRRSARAWVLARCRVPAVLLADALADAASVDADGFALVDLRLVGARLIGVEPAASNGPPAKPRGLAALVERVVGEAALDLGGRIILPRFVDAHAHPLKSNLIARTPNPTHSPNGALTCEVRDHAHWLGTAERAANALARRLDFALGCALHHGTKAMRAHLDGLQDLEPELGALVWAEFDGARARWLSRGLELQGVANLYLPAYAPADARAQARTRAHVAAAACRAGAVLGAYCPFEQTEPALLALWLDALFAHAQAQPRAPPTGAAMAAGAAPAERELDVDLHIDEHADPSYASLALPALCAALERARARGYGGHVLLGHCTALCLRLPGASASDDRARQELIERMATLGPALTVVANPLTNCALQDRQGTATPVKAVEPRLGPRTPVWRGLTALQELRAAGVRVAAASDNVRDWWFAYGDYDMLEVTSQSVRLAHLDSAGVASASHDGGAPPRPADWLALAGLWPARAICAEGGAGELLLGEPLDAIAFDARSLSELLARPQSDRAVFVRGKLLDGALPRYEELDEMNALVEKQQGAHAV